MASTRKSKEPRQYLFVRSDMPKPYGSIFWSPKVENATPFSSSEEADAVRKTVNDATGVEQVDAYGYVVKD